MNRFSGRMTETMSRYIDVTEQGMVLHTFKADGQPHPLCIVADLPVPNVDGFNALQKAAGIYRVDARDIVEAMCRHLPGGLVTEIAAALLEKHANVLRIPIHQSEVPATTR